jgi:saccharopine dehydrogenase-like NADP-dependent oxidoreductase
MPYRIVVLGGYGNFGGRVCRALASEPGVWLGMAGRSYVRAAEYGRSLGGAVADHEPIALDHRAPDFTSRLVALRPNLVIHTSGPFQGQSYHVARAAIEAGSHYLDLADGRAFVAGIGVLDTIARNRGVMVASGASTLPAVSSAVIERLAAGFDRIERIRISIAPGQDTPRGLATIESVLSYCGRAFLEWSDGKWRTVHGWQGLRRLHYPELGSRWAARCDVPDLQLLPLRYPTLRSVRFDASLDLAVAHFGLWALALLTRARIVSRPEAFAALALRAAAVLNRFGSNVGGMDVEVDGYLSDGRWRRSAWYLVAGSGDGPEIPCVPAIVVARKLARGEALTPGARPCQEMMTLAEFSAATSHLDIAWHVVEDTG